MRMNIVENGCANGARDNPLSPKMKWTGPMLYKKQVG